MLINGIHPQPHEDFSLTGVLTHLTYQWHETASGINALAPRIVNLVCSPLTELIDAIAHLAIGALSIALLAPLCRLRNAFSTARPPVEISFSGGLINIVTGLGHACGIIFTPLLGLINPSAPLKLFHGNQLIRKGSQKIHELISEKEVMAETNQSLYNSLRSIQEKHKALSADKLRLTEENKALQLKVNQLENDLIRSEEQSYDSSQSSQSSSDSDDTTLAKLKAQANVLKDFKRTSSSQSDEEFESDSQDESSS